MTEEELKDKAEDYARYTRIKDKNTYPSFPDENISDVSDFEGNRIDITERIVKSYIDGYEQSKKDLCELIREKTCEMFNNDITVTSVIEEILENIQSAK